MSNGNAHSEYVGLNPANGGGSGPAPLPKSRIQTYIIIALVLFWIRILYEFHKPLAFLFLLVAGMIGAYRLNKDSQQAIQQHNAQILNMDRINREREESEAMVHEAARMMLEINRRHLTEYLITHPDATYEQWIGNLHPENVESANVIDHRFYVEDSDHRKLWNENLGEERQFVPARSVNDSSNE